MAWGQGARKHGGWALGVPQARGIQTFICSWRVIGSPITT